jgi:hypothetical protein
VLGRVEDENRKRNADAEKERKREDAKQLADEQRKKMLDPEIGS